MQIGIICISSATETFAPLYVHLSITHTIKNHHLCDSVQTHVPQGEHLNRKIRLKTYRTSSCLPSHAEKVSSCGMITDLHTDSEKFHA